MARPSKYSAEFRCDAIALWRASAGRRTFKDVAADLNVNPETLRNWVRDADGRPVAAGASQDTEAELARLRAENSWIHAGDRCSVPCGAGCCAASRMARAALMSPIWLKA
ncbi:transposase [Streptomyces sp. NPDC097727]|uniref:transposase n=1 Tax=Streptomyces sp. NPDC097727 TaxID=3366092 RepID=UPI00380744C6